MNTWKPALVFLAFFLTGCANYKLHQSGVVTPEPMAAEVEHRLFFVGDAGEQTPIQQRNLAVLSAAVRRSEMPVSVVYLGDNVYPSGVPSKRDTANYIRAKEILLSQIEALDGTHARIYFIEGNHDWNKGKEGALKASKRMAKLLKKYEDKGVYLLPEDSCPGPEEIELTEDAVLLLVNTQWWLQDWSHEKRINEDCDAKSRLDFLAELKDDLKDSRDKQVIVAMHHPLISSGSHGGYYRFRDHLFPLTNVSPNLWIPLPVIGSIYPVYRANFGNIQDIAHPKYYELKKGIEDAVSRYDNVIFVAGHEHALEYNFYLGDHYILSGSGSRVNALAKSKYQQFGHATPGFVQLDVLKDGAVNMYIYDTSTGDVNAEPVFAKNLGAGVKHEVDIESLPEASELEEETTAILSEEYDKSGLYRWLFGERYRSLYKVPLTAPNINLEEKHGGLKPVKKGGGFQTNSLRLEADDGKQYVLRSINKDASRLLPEVFQSTFATDILQDQFTASHPYAAFVIPDMADAAGIFHTNPELVYLPAQKALGRFADDFADDLYLFEERPDGDWEGYASFGGSNKIVSYSKMIEKTVDDFEDRVDQELVLRSRLFDMFIGDWDRHDDQWRWASFEVDDGDGDIYRPIPRDRDQVFSTYDGVIVRLANWYTPALRKMSRFTGDIKSVKWYNFNARYFDRDFLNMLTRDQWMQMATDLQVRLSDDVIESSLRQWPESVYNEHGEKIEDILKARRDKLPLFAERYYDELAKMVSVTGSDDADFFEITNTVEGVRVRVFDSNKEGEKHELFYDRTFDGSETNEIRVYGGDGHDHFSIDSDMTGGIRIRVIGGEDEDTYASEGETRPEKLTVYDREDSGEVSLSRNLRYKRLRDDEANTFDRMGFQYDYAIPLIVIGGNPDDGLLLGGGVQFVRHGFNREPFASRHSFRAFYAFGSGSYGLSYHGEWNDAIRNVNLGLHARFEGPTYVQNYFGRGNDTEQAVDDIDFYRVRKRTYGFIPSIGVGQDDGSKLTLHLGVESHRIERTSGRIVTDPDINLPDIVFDERTNGIARIEYKFESVDHPLLTRRGVRFHLAGGMDYTFSEETTHRYASASFATYYQLKGLGKPTIATRIGAEWHGGDYLFYEAALLGSHDNFRGVRKERFNGDRMFYHNTDLRIRLAQWQGYYLPAAMGIVVNFDHGRVWLDDEESDSWHYAYGGGVWISPFQTLLLSLNYNVSDVDERFSAAMGFFF